MSENIAWIFAGGKRVTKTIAATAGDVAATLSPTAGKRWKVLHGILTLVCDATVVDRYIRGQLTDGTNITCDLFSSAAVTASQTKLAGILAGKASASALHVYFERSRDMILEGADELKFYITSGVAGDSYSGHVVILEIEV